jgi:hypothetical protein
MHNKCVMGYLNSLSYSSIERTSVGGGYIQKPIGIYNTISLWPKDEIASNSPGIMVTRNNLVLLAMHSLDVLASKDRVVVDDMFLRTDVRLGVCVELLGLVCEVEVDGVGPCEGD